MVLVAHREIAIVEFLTLQRREKSHLRYKKYESLVIQISYNRLQ